MSVKVEWFYDTSRGGLRRGTPKVWLVVVKQEVPHETRAAAMAHASSIRTALKPRVKKSQWVKNVVDSRPRCDLCSKLAKYSHPEGGLRCEKCPKPEKR